MTDPRRAGTDEQRYEAALRALVAIPATLRAALSEADREHRDRVAVAEQVLTSERQRLGRLERTVQHRYRAAAASLREHGVPVPEQVRPAPGTPGDPGGLARALEAHAAAVAAVDSAVAATRRASERAGTDPADRAAAQQAAEALARRRRRAEDARSAAQAQARLDAARTDAGRRARSRRVLVLVLGVAVLAATGLLLAVLT